MSPLNYVELNPEVQDAIQRGKAIVALESTIVSHGMPYPSNVATAQKVEQKVRAYGAIPATIAIIDGVIKVGLSDDELDELGRGQEVIKCGTRDIPMIIANNQHGATTVSATMAIAKMAGIRIFATGGIGGVHRNGESTMDISSDLQELAQTSVAVVTAGAKSILDLGLTLEYLETHRVPVIGFQADFFPAFFLRSSGLPIHHRCDTPEQLASYLDIKWKLGLTGGVVIANPIPLESEIEYRVIQDALEQAINESTAMKLGGKELTPFLLNRIRELTQGDSLRSNIDLVLNNACLAAKTAVALTKIGK